MRRSPSTTGTLVNWTEQDVNEWLSTLGFSQYQNQIIEHGISGEILSLLDHEGLKEVGVHSVGQRLVILREVYHLKVAHGIPIESEHYVPPSEIIESSAQEGVSLDRLHEMIQELGERTRVVEEENRKLSDNLTICLDELSSLKSTGKTPLHDNSNLRKQPSFRFAGQDHPIASPVRPTPDPPHESPRTSPQRPDHDVSSSLLHHVKPPRTTPVSSTAESSRPVIDRSNSNPQLSGSTSRLPLPSQAGSSSTPAPLGSSNGAQPKSFKVSLDDPCWKVLPAALKKYKMNDDWRHFVMFICYGSTERCLSYDEKPLLLFQKLKDANKNPVFMLRPIKDIRSPISVAQQKQAQRLRETGGNGGLLGPAATSSRIAAASGTASSTAVAASPYSRNTRLHQPPVLQPISAQAHAFKQAGGSTNGAATSNPANPSQWPETAAGEAHPDTSQSRLQAGDEQSPHPDVKESLAAANEASISYAIAIYPYMAEQDDEFDVVVDDTFIILSRTKGWWVVQRDIDGSGAVNDSAKAWVPAGCLLETSIPSAAAISDAKGSVSPARTTSASGLHSPNGSPSPSPHKSPILPSSIISTSFPGLALMNYSGKGEYELGLLRGDILRVFKRYNHWSYAIKETSGDRGWVPSWLVGKYNPGATVLSSSLVPPTPTFNSMSNLSPNQGPGEASEMLEVADRSFTSGALMNGSPLSPAFPSTQPTLHSKSSVPQI